MAKTGEYSDVLRAIGRLLDLQGARDLEIVDEGPFLRASWQVTSGTREQRIYRAFELDRLRLESKLLRSGDTDGEPESNLSEALRTIGGEMDRAQYELLSLAQTGAGFQVSMMAGVHHLTRIFGSAEIVTLGLEQRSRRRALPGQSRPA